MATEDSSGIDLHPRLRYSDADGIHVEVQGINLYLTPAMLQLAESQGSVETATRIPAGGVESVFDTVLGEDMQLTIRIEPVVEAADE